VKAATKVKRITLCLPQAARVCYAARAERQWVRRADASDPPPAHPIVRQRSTLH